LVIQLDGIGTLNANAGSEKAKKVTANNEHIYSILRNCEFKHQGFAGLGRRSRNIDPNDDPEILNLMMIHEND
jgi:hypothetical protein